MNCNIQEENGAFREFFPDPEQRTQVHFAFTFQFLPQNVAQNPYAFFSYLYRQDLPGGAMEPTRFIQARWTLFEEKAGLAPSSLETIKTDVLRSRRLTDLSMSLHEVDGNAAAVIQMPAPESAGLAYVIAVVLLAPAARPEEWPRDVRARVFTLERTFDSASENATTGAVCELAGSGPNQRHINHGFGIPIDRDAFLKRIAVHLHEAEMPPGAGLQGAAALALQSGEPPEEVLSVAAKVGIFIFIFTGPLLAFDYWRNNGSLTILGKIQPSTLLQIAAVGGAVAGGLLAGRGRRLLAIACSSLAGFGSCGLHVLYTDFLERQRMFSFETIIIALLGALPGLVLYFVFDGFVLPKRKESGGLATFRDGKDGQ